MLAKSIFFQGQYFLILQAVVDPCGYFIHRFTTPDGVLTPTLQTDNYVGVNHVGVNRTLYNKVFPSITAV